MLRQNTDSNICINKYNKKIKDNRNKSLQERILEITMILKWAKKALIYILLGKNKPKPN